ncbi:hypothetical protein C2S51_021248, partial [Perilla frutescens var. frutescens]
MNKIMRDLSVGPPRSVNIYHGYFVNGYKFHIVEHGSHRVTVNSGVCVKGTNYITDESDYYGCLVEVLELEYPGLPIKRTVLFKCEWFGTSPAGTTVHPDYIMMSARGGGRASRGSSRALVASPSSSTGLSGGVGGLDLEGSSVGHVVDSTGQRVIRVDDGNWRRLWERERFKMSAARFDVEKFIDKSDFGLWKVKMRALLIQQGLKEALKQTSASSSGKENEKSEDHAQILEKAHSMIILSLGNKSLRE